jgi:hypothetical protein
MTFISHFEPFTYKKRTPFLLRSICIIFLGLTLISRTSFAQHPNRKAIDTLLTELPHTVGSLRIDCLNSLSEQYWWSPRPNPDSIFFYANQAFLLSKNTSNGYGLAMAKLNLGISEYCRRNYPQAEKDILESIGISYKNHNAKILGYGYLYLGSIHYLKNENTKAERDYDKVTIYFDETGDK